MDAHPCPSRAPPLERVPRAPPAGPEALVQDGGQDRCRVLGGALRLVEVREEELQRRLLREDVGLCPHLLEEGAVGRPCPADAGWTPGGVDGLPLPLAEHPSVISGPPSRGLSHAGWGGPSQELGRPEADNFCAEGSCNFFF